MALSTSIVTPTLKLSPPLTSQPPRLVHCHSPTLLLRIPSNPTTSNNKLLSAAASDKWRVRISFFPAFLNKGKDVSALKEELLEAIAPLDGGAEATPEDQQMVDQLSRKLEAANPIKEPLKSNLLNGKWELIYTTSRSILQTERPKLLRSRANYQGINVDTLRAQNLESWPFFNQDLNSGKTIGNAKAFSGLYILNIPKSQVKQLCVTANLTPLNTRKVAVQFDTFKILGLIPVKAPGRARGELEITYLDEELRISRGDKGNLFILKMVDPSYRVPV